jgi:hypothetical protein
MEATPAAAAPGGEEAKSGTKKLGGWASVVKKTASAGATASDAPAPAAVLSSTPSTDAPAAANASGADGQQAATVGAAQPAAPREPAALAKGAEAGEGHVQTADSGSGHGGGGDGVAAVAVAAAAAATPPAGRAAECDDGGDDDRAAVKDAQAKAASKPAKPAWKKVRQGSEEAARGRGHGRGRGYRRGPDLRARMPTFFCQCFSHNTHVPA